MPGALLTLAVYVAGWFGAHFRHDGPARSFSCRSHRAPLETNGRLQLRQSISTTESLNLSQFVAYDPALESRGLFEVASSASAPREAEPSDLE
jgi:hypothetical protein